MMQVRPPSASKTRLVAGIVANGWAEKLADPTQALARQQVVQHRPTSQGGITVNDPLRHPQVDLLAPPADLGGSGRRDVCTCFDPLVTSFTNSPVWASLSTPVVAETQPQDQPLSPATSLSSCSDRTLCTHRPRKLLGGGGGEPDVGAVGGASSTPTGTGAWVAELFERGSSPMVAVVASAPKRLGPPVDRLVVTDSLAAGDHRGLRIEVRRSPHCWPMPSTASTATGTWPSC
jgi:hypothetical protein